MSKTRIALLCAGQGAQAVGMGKELAEASPAAAALFEKADRLLGWKLSEIAFNGPSEELTKTSVAQPALYVHALAALAALREKQPDFAFDAAAGLSLGEFTAHAAAGTFDFETGLDLVAKRSRFMQDACEQSDGGMAAMIGADENTVRDLAAAADVDVANLNCPGQVVISGEGAHVALAVSLAREYGVRKAVELQVAGAFHSRLMEPAYQRLREVLEQTGFSEPRVPVICNVDAVPVRSPEEIRRTLADQVTGSVRWSESVEYLLDHLHCTHFLELGPGGVLAGMMGRIRKGTPVHSISNAADLEQAVAALRV